MPKHEHSLPPPPPNLLLLFSLSMYCWYCWSWYHMVWNIILLVSLGQITCFCSLLAFCSPPNFLFDEGRVCVGGCRPWHCSNTFQQKNKTLVNYKCFFIHKSITPHTDCYEENSIPSRISTASTLYSKVFTTCSGHRLSSISSLTPFFLSPSHLSPSLSSFSPTVIIPLIYEPSLNYIPQPTVAYHRQVWSMCGRKAT